MRYLHTISKKDVGKRFINVQKECPTCGHIEKLRIDMQDVLGKVLPQDQNRKIYQSARKIIYVEVAKR